MATQRQCRSPRIVSIHKSLPTDARHFDRTPNTPTDVPHSYMCEVLGFSWMTERATGRAVPCVHGSGHTAAEHRPGSRACRRRRTLPPPVSINRIDLRREAGVSHDRRRDRPPSSSSWFRAQAVAAAAIDSLLSFPGSVAALGPGVQSTKRPSADVVTDVRYRHSPTTPSH